MVTNYDDKFDFNILAEVAENLSFGGKMQPSIISPDFKKDVPHKGKYSIQLMLHLEIWF